LSYVKSVKSNTIRETLTPTDFVFGVNRENLLRWLGFSRIKSISITTFINNLTGNLCLAMLRV
jgi:hypothetical protein